MLTRRDLLHVGSLGLLGLGLPELFQSRRARAADGRAARDDDCWP